MKFIELATQRSSVRNFDVEKYCEIFNTPENIEPIALIPIGYPATKPVPAKRRKSIDQLVSWNQVDFE